MFALVNCTYIKSVFVLVGKKGVGRGRFVIDTVKG